MEFQQILRSDAEKVFITVTNNDNAILGAGVCVEWTSTTTVAAQGVYVNLINAALNATTGIGGQVAGVTDAAINTTPATGRLQIYGVDTVRASASLDLNRLVITSSINGSNIGHVMAHATGQSTEATPEFFGAVVGWTLENGPNATNSTVFLTIM